MNERTALSTFDCTRLGARVTEAGCARMWRSTQERAPKPWESRAACQGCPIGAQNAGADIAAALTVARALEMAPVCVRCNAIGRRMVGGTHCVSCYNRLREATIGKDARGRVPRLRARLYSVPLIIQPADGAVFERVCQGVTSRAEAILTVAKATAGAAVAIGWPRLVELPSEAQPELGADFARRQRRPRPVRAPSCPVSIIVDREPAHAA